MQLSALEFVANYGFHGISRKRAFSRKADSFAENVTNGHKNGYARLLLMFVTLRQVPVSWRYSYAGLPSVYYRRL